VITVSKDVSGRITVAFRYNPLLVSKVKTIPAHRWQPTEEHWSFPNSDKIVEKILKVFEGEEIRVDPVLKADIPSPSKTSISHCEAELKQSQKDYTVNPPLPPFRKGGQGGI
jgi:hypothetical protein